MAVEIERKFLVKNDAYKQQAVKKTFYKQGYLKKTGKSIIRVRIAEDKAFITIKGQTKGIARAEFEYEIPANDANIMLQSICEGHIIEKYRYIVPSSAKDLVWEVDEFLGVNHGLVLAEIELKTISDTFEKPNWIGKEVSSNSRYYNSNISKNPYMDKFLKLFRRK
jgi:CYTH domain-containing protein